MSNLENTSILELNETPVMSELAHEKVLYETVYKKGMMKGEMRFYHNGPLASAVIKVKEYLEKRHLKHLHTMPFVIDLTNENLDEQMKMMQ